MLGFPTAAAVIGAVTILAVWILADLLFSRSPEQMGLMPDGATPGALVKSQPTPASLLWRDWTFLTLAGGTACGLFAQIGLIAHLYS